MHYLRASRPMISAALNVFAITKSLAGLRGRYNAARPKFSVAVESEVENTHFDTLSTKPRTVQIVNMNRRHPILDVGVRFIGRLHAPVRPRRPSQRVARSL